MSPKENILKLFRIAYDNVSIPILDQGRTFYVIDPIEVCRVADYSPSEFIDILKKLEPEFPQYRFDYKALWYSFYHRGQINLFLKD